MPQVHGEEVSTDVPTRVGQHAHGQVDTRDGEAVCFKPRHVASRPTADVKNVRTAPGVPHESFCQRDQVGGQWAMIAVRVCQDDLIVCGLDMSSYV